MVRWQDIARLEAGEAVGLLSGAGACRVGGAFGVAGCVRGEWVGCVEFGDVVADGGVCGGGAGGAGGVEA